MADSSASGWSAWRPPWYPNQDPTHNPWLLAEPIAGLTHYQVWEKGLPEGRLLELIREYRDRARSGDGGDRERDPEQGPQSTEGVDVAVAHTLGIDTRSAMLE